MKNKVFIVDYDMCNLLNVVRAFEHVGADVTVISDPAEVSSAGRLVVPGVGAFADCMREMVGRGFAEKINAFAKSGNPLMGICVGMQALFDGSEEFGDTPGLGLIPGRVRLIPNTMSDGRAHRIPHIGWNELQKPTEPTSWQGTVLEDTPDATAMYFVHSYTPMPEQEDHRLADAWYGGRRIAAAVRRDNIYGCQFHPERSGEAGLKILSSFARM